jgi:hypothetical protein
MRPFVEDAPRRGVEVAVQIGSVGEAEAAAATGVAAVIAQGIEAGCQLRGKASIWDLLPSVVEAVSRSRCWPRAHRRRRRDRPRVAPGSTGRLARDRLGGQRRGLDPPRLQASASVESGAKDTSPESCPPAAAARRQGAPRKKAFAAWNGAGRPEPGQRPGLEQRLAHSGSLGRAVLGA